MRGDLVKEREAGTVCRKVDQPGLLTLSSAVVLLPDPSVSVACSSPPHTIMPSRRWLWVRPTPHVYSYNRELSSFGYSSTAAAESSRSATTTMKTRLNRICLY